MNRGFYFIWTMIFCIILLLHIIIFYTYCVIHFSCFYEIIFYVTMYDRNGKRKGSERRVFQSYYYNCDFFLETFVFYIAVYYYRNWKIASRILYARASFFIVKCIDRRIDVHPRIFNAAKPFLRDNFVVQEEEGLETRTRGWYLDILMAALITGHDARRTRRSR